MSRQTTLLTSHKGVDLHAATALRVMRERLDGGEALEGLYRCEMHTFITDESGLTMEQLLAAGRYYNPNKHHFGHFEGPLVPELFAPERARFRALPAEWPGRVQDTDLELPAEELYDVLLGGLAPRDCCAVDVAAFSLGQNGPLVSGVLWRLMLHTDPNTAADLGDRLAVTRGRKQGLLINPHMEAWLTAVRQEIR
ncbi:MAG: hypothetical protein E4H17_04515 [Gemmatimonadales bacterium]|nr:MAG: hypothetical protein E4H17_04515 [Gemmatimonadales bacterium]